MAKKSQMSKIYREFTRIKFQKYRLQFPKVRESELIAKILKEWEAMDEETKKNLGQDFIQRTGKGFLQDPSSSSKKDNKKQKTESKPMSSSARESGAKKITKKKKPSPKLRVFVDKSSPKDLLAAQDEPDFKKIDRENSKSPGKKSTPQKKSGSSSSELALKKAKGDGKVEPKKKVNPRAEQYMNFFKYYHDRLTSEHPRWSAVQISTIIKLLWKKRNIKEKTKRRQIPGRVLSGRQLYNRTKLSEGLIREQIKQLWRALPFESKKYWQIKGQGKPHRSDKDSGKFVRRILNSGATKENVGRENDGGLNWMNQQMK